MNKKENFSYDVSSLSTYTNELNADVGTIMKKMFDTRSLQMFNKYPTNNGSNKLNVLSNTVLFQDGGSCSLETSGETVYTQQTITAEPINVTKSFCGKDFFDYWQSLIMKDTLTGKEIPEEETLIEQQLSDIAKQNEYAIWQAVDGGSKHYDKFDGLIEVLSGQTTNSATTTEFEDSGATSETIIDIIDAMIEEVETDILTEDLKLFLSPKNYNLWIKALSTQDAANNNYMVDNSNFRRKHPTYTNVEVVAVDGLTGTDYMVLTFTDNIYQAIPKNGDEIKTEWVTPVGKDRNHYFVADFMMGVQVGIPSYVVTNF